MRAAATAMSFWRAWAGGTNFPLHLAVCLGLGEAVHQRLDPGEPEQLGALTWTRLVRRVVRQRPETHILVVLVR